MKIIGGSNTSRIMHLILLILPIVIIVFILIIKNDIKLIISKGYIVFFIIYSTITFYHLKWNVFDWDLFIDKNKILLKRMFTSQKVYFNADRINVSHIFILSFLFKLYRIQINDDYFLIKTSSFGNVFQSLFKQEMISKKIKEKILESFDNGTD